MPLNLIEVDEVFAPFRRLSWQPKTLYNY